LNEKIDELKVMSTSQDSKGVEATILSRTLKFLVPIPPFPPHTKHVIALSVLSYSMWSLPCLLVLKHSFLTWLQAVLDELRTDLARAKKGKPPLKGADGKQKKNLNPEA